MDEPRSRPRIDVLGVGVDAVGPADVRDWIEAALEPAAPALCRQVVTLNPEYVIAARGDPVFAHAIRRAELVVADGIGVVAAASILGARKAARLRRVTGLDLCDVLAAAGASARAPLFLLGGRDGAAAGAAARLTDRFPGLPIAGTWEGGGPGAGDDAASLARIETGGARVVLVAYGAPGQVLWIERNREALGRAGVRVAIGVGGAFDYLSGRVPRAPRLVRRLGCEWLYRLVREPWRWRRQVALLRFAALVAVSLARCAIDRSLGRDRHRNSD